MQHAETPGAHEIEGLPQRPSSAPPVRSTGGRRGKGPDELGVLEVGGVELEGVGLGLDRELEDGGSSASATTGRPEARAAFSTRRQSSSSSTSRCAARGGGARPVAPTEHREQDRVGAHLERRLDHAQGGLGRAFVGLGHLGHHERRLAIAHGPTAHGQSPGPHRAVAPTLGARFRGRRP